MSPIGVMTQPRIILLMALVLGSSQGCRPLPTSHTPMGRETVSHEDRAAVLRQKFQSAAERVFEAHHFPPPAVRDGARPAASAMSARPHSAQEVEMALAELSQAGEVKLQIRSYAWVGSDWALLGRLFTGPVSKEASEMERAIQEQLTK